MPWAGSAGTPFLSLFYGLCGFCLCCFSIVHFTVGNVLFVVAIVILCVVSIRVSFHLVKVSVVILVIVICHCFSGSPPPPAT